MTGCFLRSPVWRWSIQNSRHIHNPIKYLWWKILFATLYNPSIFRTVAYSESKAYSEYCQISIKKYFIQNLMYNPDILRTLGVFRTLVYSEIKAYSEPTEYLRWSILLRTLCNYSRFRDPIYSKLSHIQNRCVSTTP